MFQVSQVNKIQVVSFDGKRATADIAHEFRDFLFELIDNQKVKYVLLDLTGVVFIDSFFLGAIVSGLKKIRAFGGDMKIYNLSKSVLPVFKLMHLNEVFEIFNQKEEAIGAFTIPND